MRSRRMATALVVAMLLITSCGGESNGPKQGVHDHGGKDAFNASLVAENVIADVTVAPAKVGDVIVHMEFSPPGGKLQPTPGEWTLEFDAVLADGTTALYTTKVTFTS